QLPLALARCYQVLAQTERAEEQYLAALADRPDDFIILHKVADFYLGSPRPKKALPYLRRLLVPAVSAPDDQVTWARRRLAVLLAGSGGETGIREALALLEQNRE